MPPPHESGSRVPTLTWTRVVLSHFKHSEYSQSQRHGVRRPLAFAPAACKKLASMSLPLSFCARHTAQRAPLFRTHVTSFSARDTTAPRRFSRSDSRVLAATTAPWIRTHLARLAFSELSGPPYRPYACRSPLALAPPSGPRYFSSENACRITAQAATSTGRWHGPRAASGSTSRRRSGHGTRTLPARPGASLRVLRTSWLLYPPLHADPGHLSAWAPILRNTTQSLACGPPQDLYRLGPALPAAVQAYIELSRLLLLARPSHAMLPPQLSPSTNPAPSRPESSSFRPHHLARGGLDFITTRKKTGMTRARGVLARRREGVVGVGIMSLCALCLRVRGAHPHHNWRRGWTECEISRTTRNGDGGEAEARPLWMGKKDGEGGWRTEGIAASCIAHRACGFRKWGTYANRGSREGAPIRLARWQCGRCLPGFRGQGPQAVTNLESRAVPTQLAPWTWIGREEWGRAGMIRRPRHRSHNTLIPAHRPPSSPSASRPSLRTHGFLSRRVLVHP
ncbi:hypothetical protein B0H13DRAFT_2263968 [Mycena leptocephala]|nr:hypothetical protein B0H13DRAFT_2263968 [Mycena leptocephala]